MAPGLSSQQMGRLARIGAAARLAELQQEIAALRRAFSGLKASGPAPQVSERPAAPKTTGKTRRKRRAMTAAEKKAASERMRKYWADRKKTKL